jgi:hypothetical protein
MRKDRGLEEEQISEEDRLYLGEATLAKIRSGALEFGGAVEASDEYTVEYEDEAEGEYEEEDDVEYEPDEDLEDEEDDELSDEDDTE